MVKGVPTYTFNNALVNNLPNLDEKAPNDRWSLTWTSEESCKAKKESKFEVVLTATCDSKKDAKSTFTLAAADASTCKAAMTYTGPNACGTSLPIVDAMAKLAPFFGAILIIFGAIMTFKGQALIFKLFGAIVSLVAAGIIFGMIYALFLPVNTNTGLLLGVIVAALGLGALIAYFTNKITKKLIVPILGAVSGIVVFLMIAKIFSFNKGLYNTLFAIAGAILGWFLGFKFDSIIKSLSTALIGSFLLVRGIGCYAPGYPSEFNVSSIATNPNQNIETIGYLAAFVILAIAGFIYQAKTTKTQEEANEDDEFLNQEENRTCGCF